MATPCEKLAASFELLHKLQSAHSAALRAKDMPPTHRQRLKANGFLRAVMKGWYAPSSARRKGRRQHGLVCLLLALRCRLFENTLR
jgi:hypothetical protein